MTENLKESVQKISLVGVCIQCNQPSALTNTSDVCPKCSGRMAPVQSEKLDGEILDNAYRIDREIGSGAWGTVYRAEQISIGRTVAIKILHRHLVSNKNKVERFKHEAHSLKEIKHNGVAQLYDLGILPDGRPYLVEEYVEGTSLQDILKGVKPLSIEKIKILFGQILQTLQEMHARKIIHRDIKPGNIIVESFDSDQPKVKLLDFGIAKLGESDSSLTSTGELMGTPLYMSPEQCVGDELDGRSDIYSLGCVLYEALSAAPPFLAETSFQCMLAHVNNPVPELLATGVPEELRAVVKTAMAKAPANRYANAQQFAEALHAVPQTSVKRGAKSSGKEALIVAAVIGLLGFVGAAGWFATHTNQSAPTTQPEDVPTVSTTTSSPPTTSNQQELYEEIQDTPRARLESLKSRIKRGIEFTRKSGDTATAAAHAKELEKILQSANDGQLFSSIPELHVVGIEWGKQTGKFNSGGTAEIDIRYTQAPVVLVISTYNMYNMEITIKTDPGVKLKEILTCGNLDGKLRGVPDGVPVRSIRGGDETLMAYNEQFGWTHFKETIENRIGLPIKTFLPDRGAKPYLLGPMDQEFCDRLIVSRLSKFAETACANRDKATLASLKDLRFVACVQKPLVQAQDGGIMADTSNQQSVAAEFNVRGPLKKTMRDLHGSFSQIVADTDPNIAWGLKDFRLHKIDLKTGKTTLIVPPDNIPDNFFNIAYLPETKEVLASTQWMVKYNPRTKKWNPTTDFPMTGQGLAYSQRDKCFYAFGHTNISPGAVQTLYKINLNGKVVERIALSEPIPMPGEPIQTIVTNKGVVAIPLPEILYGPEVGPDGNTVMKLADQLIFLIDPKTGEVIYKNKLAEQP